MSGVDWHRFCRHVQSEMADVRLELFIAIVHSIIATQMSQNLTVVMLPKKNPSKFNVKKAAKKKPLVAAELCSMLTTAYASIIHPRHRME